jgi:hypothetical protein
MADLSVTAANVLQSSGTSVSSGVASTAITRGQYVYVLANGTIGLADSNGASPANSVAGCCLADVATSQTCFYVAVDSGFTPGFTVLAGDTIWLSNTPGACTKTYADVAAGSTVIPLGVMTSTTVMRLSPLVGGVKA